MKKRIMLAGAGGFGETYVRQLCALADEGALQWVGVVDPYAAKSNRYGDILARGIPVFDTIEAFAAQGEADLAVLCTPIAFHCQQAAFAMRSGMDVLIEKPVAATLEEARRIAGIRDETGKKASVAFQWCYDPVMLRLKALSDGGAFGPLRRLRSLVLWPRPERYYRRNTWAGKAYDAQGRPVHDNISSNATAHYLFNMLWLAGEGYQGARIEGVEASLFRANDIETFDTATIRVTLPGGVQALHVASHAVENAQQQNPMFLYEYEHARVSFGRWGETGGDILVEYDDGRHESLGRSYPDTGEKLTRTVAELGMDTQPVCPVEAAEKHLVVMEALRGQQIPVHTLADVRHEGDLRWVPGLADRLAACYERFALLGDTPV